MTKSIFLLLVFVCTTSLIVADEILIVKNIIIVGNEKTKEAVILREFPYSSGDSILTCILDQELNNFRNNLLKTSLFNFVEINQIRNKNDVDIFVTVEERWYWWVYPIFEQADRNLSSFLYNRDFSMINYGAAADILNFRGLNEILKFKLRMGYKEHYSASYIKPGIGVNRTSGFMVFADYFKQKSAIFKIEGNKPYYSQSNNLYSRKLLKYGLAYSYRPEINYRISSGIAFRHIYLYDEVFFQNLSPETMFKDRFLSTYFKFVFDNQNSKVYPTKGFCIETGITDNISINQSSSYSTVELDVKYNSPLFSEKVFYKTNFSLMLLDKRGDEGLLFDNKLEFISGFWIRGYEYFYLTGDNLFKFQNTFSFRLRDFRIHKLPAFLPDEFRKTYSVVYLEVFADCAYSSGFAENQQNLNPMNGKLLYSTGIGISLETYYDRLLQFRVAYNSYSEKIGIFADYKTPIYKLF